MVKRYGDLPRPSLHKFKLETVQEGVDNSTTPPGLYFSNGRKWIWMGSNTADIKLIKQRLLTLENQTTTNNSSSNRFLLMGG